ncbi:uncharacterized protein MCYG_06168 [Microsporum canis CBS 113480]|uniref:Extracellular membrane protein CFEM domain-containing protein n=1 Tax=Arthroderma otae (strain ATCC MYA-4605 / CBS 113480) TaxID=554155 RepID=C5FTW5_ARTOC|nr:uncharacterized protein MCYG_06168 [Microsporum canis CBS 113480]EEQ33349.1 predicted protein [Microsporum canis CBS 113480]
MLFLVVPYLLATPFFCSSVRADGPVSLDQMEDIAASVIAPRHSCFGYWDAATRIADELSCPSAVMNDFFCRVDLQVTATSYLPSCVNKFCSSNSIDVTWAVGIYTDYCTSAGYISTLLHRKHQKLPVNRTPTLAPQTT